MFSFDAMDHGWIVKFVEHRIADRRIVRLIQKWLSAGVLEDGTRRRSEVGSPQGGSISPLLANLYLHYVFDVWVRRWREKRATGEMIVVRFADDIIVGFQHRSDAERFRTEMGERFARFALELHPDKTCLIEFGRFATENRRQAGRGKPETFDFLGFTHICGKTRSGRFTVVRRTMRKRMQAKLREVRTDLRRRMHDPVPEMGKWLGSVIRGHNRYYGVPMNTSRLSGFRYEVCHAWHRTLCRRSQRGHVPWTRMTRLISRWIPPARVHHPYPSQRLRVTTQGRSPVR